jgi:hypothetical protein
MIDKSGYFQDILTQPFLITQGISGYTLVVGKRYPYQVRHPLDKFHYVGIVLLSAVIMTVTQNSRSGGGRWFVGFKFLRSRIFNK